MAHRKIVRLSSDEEDDDDDNGESFISGNAMKSLHNAISNFNKLGSQLFKDDLAKQRNNRRMQQQPTNNIKSSKACLEDSFDIITVDDTTEPGSKQSSVKEKATPIVVDIDDDDDVEILAEIPKGPSKSRDDSLTNILSTSFTEEQNEAFLAKQDSMPMRIKIKRLNRIEYFSIIPNQPLSSILDEVSERFKIPVSSIILYLNENQVDLKASPKSLNVTIVDFFNIMARRDESLMNPTSCPSDQDANTDSTANDPSFVTLHLRDNTKKRLTTRINRYKLVRDLAEYYAKEKGVSIDKLILEFDSEPMSMDKKLDYFEPEDDDQVDIILK